ncbi:hypothetical protein DF041_17755 [Burkholderia cepacia]|nr:hypothetical protein DF041_17755 [Burkholderia cepacia]
MPAAVADVTFDITRRSVEEPGADEACAGRTVASHRTDAAGGSGIVGASSRLPGGRQSSSGSSNSLWRIA